MSSYSPWHYKSIRTVAGLAAIAFVGSALAQAATVDIHPGDDIPSIVNSSPAGTKFVIYPGTYRLTQPIVPKNGDVFIGQTACAPPKTSCPAVLSGSVIIGPKATFDGTYYKVTGQTQQGDVTIESIHCLTGFEGCIYPEDLYFDGVPLQHLYSAVLPTIATGQWWFDYASHVIYFHDNPAGHVVETSVVPRAFCLTPLGCESTANNVTVRYLTIEEFATPILFGTVDGAGSGFGSPTLGANWVVQQNEIRLNHGTGVRPNFGWQVLNNYSHNNGDVGLGGGIGGGNSDGTGTLPSNLLIQGNEVAYNDYAHVNPGFESGGGKGTVTRGLVYRGNYAHNNLGPGLWTDGDNYDSLYDNNTIVDNSDSGAFHEISYGGTVMRNNKLSNNGYNEPPVSSGGYHTNLFSSTSQGVEAYCNTIEVSATGGNAMVMLAADRGSDTFPPYQKFISSGNYFHHNTVSWASSSNAPLGLVGGVNEDTTGQPNFYKVNPGFDYNQYHLPSLAQHAFQWGGPGAKTFAYFQSEGMDTHGTADDKNTTSVPNVTITSPVDGSTVSGTVSVTGTVQDSSPISTVELYVDWTLKATDGGKSPFSLTWNTDGAKAGPHTVAAMAYNADGIRACYAVTLNLP